MPGKFTGFFVMILWLRSGDIMFNKKLFEKFDYVLFMIILALMAIGIVALTSATHAIPTGDMADVEKQVMWIIISITAMLAVAAFDYETLGSYSFRLYVLMLVLLIAVLFTRPINGASSWFNLGPFAFQPSEIAKIILIISLAKHIDRITSKDENAINKPKNILMLLLHVGIPILLIMKQPDFGTAMVIVSIVFIMVFLANMSYKYVGTVAIGGVLGIGLLRFFILKGNNLFFSEYQAKRIKVFFDPTLDPHGSGYNVLQSKLAIGSGQVSGMGLLNGTQTQLGNIPAKTTDFIFSVIGEELGFIFCALIVVLFVLLLLRCISIARISKDFYGALITVGVMTMIGIHVLVNIGMTIGLVPVTGIPLPFISYGGSSLLTNMMGIGLVMSVAAKNK